MYLQNNYCSLSVCVFFFVSKIKTSPLQLILEEINLISGLKYLIMLSK